MDAYDEYEQLASLHAVIKEHLAVPFRTTVLGVQPGPAERIARLPAATVLERIGRARLQRDELDAELTPRS